METNHRPKKDSELYRKGQALIEAGQAYWEEYQKVCTPGAIVWLTMNNGNFILFTRGEYKEDLISVIQDLEQDKPLDKPFED
jgi:hypothetical protein